MAKVMISMPDELLAEIDTAAQRRSMSRSEFIRESAKREMQRRDPEAMRRAIEELRADFAEVSLSTEEALREHGRAWLDRRDRARYGKQ